MFELSIGSCYGKSVLLWSKRDICMVYRENAKQNIWRTNFMSSKDSYEINELVISTNKRQRQVNRLLIRKRRLINVNKLISGKITIPLWQINSFFASNRLWKFKILIIVWCLNGNESKCQKIYWTMAAGAFIPNSQMRMYSVGRLQKNPLLKTAFVWFEKNQICIFESHLNYQRTFI